VLKEAGLVRVRPQGRWRFYSVEGRALRQVLEWLERFTGAWNDPGDRQDAQGAGQEEEVPCPVGRTARAAPRSPSSRTPPTRSSAGSTPRPRRFSARSPSPS